MRLAPQNVCLLGGFHPYTNGDVSITGKGLQILTYIRHSWQLGSRVFFYRDTSNVTAFKRIWSFLKTSTPVIKHVLNIISKNDTIRKFNLNASKKGVGSSLEFLESA